MRKKSYKSYFIQRQVRGSDRTVESATHKMVRALFTDAAVFFRKSSMSRNG